MKRLRRQNGREGRAGRHARWTAALPVWALSCGILSSAPPLAAGVFGVPTAIGSDGRVCLGNNNPAGIGCTAAALDPPGYVLVHGTDDTDAAGDPVHQSRLFIEVTGTTLDVRVFDAGRSGLRDNPQGDTSSFTYTLRSPSGVVLKSITMGADSGVTENRLARMSAAAADTTFVALNAGTAFTVAPGRHELRITASNGASDDDRNGLGVDLRDGTGANAGHYNVYTWGEDDDSGAGSSPLATDTSLVIGGLSTGGNAATISQGMIAYPYITRGCDLSASNYDMDQATATASASDTTGAATTYTNSGNATEATTSDTVHATTGVLTDANNYGLWSLSNNTGTQFNVIDWRFADFRGWADAPVGLPRDPVDPLRTYLPNGYTGGVPPLSNATAPLEPRLTASYGLLSGANPPAVGQLSRFRVQVALYNPGPAAVRMNAADDSIVSGLPAGATNLHGIRCFHNDWFTLVGTPVNGGTFARCDLSGANLTLAVGDVLVLSYQFDVTPAVAGTFAITNPPAAPAAGQYNAGALGPNSTTWAQYSRFPTGTVLAETLGPLCDLRAATGTLVTRASLAGLRVDPRGTVEFAVRGQRGTLAYQVYTTGDRNGGLRLWSPRPIAAARPDSLGPQLYRFEGAPLQGQQLVIEELEQSGRRRWLGPFASDDARLAAGYARAAAEASATPPGTRARLASSPATPRVLTRTDGIVIEAPAGLVHVPLADLEALGLPHQPSELRLTRLGNDVPFEIAAGPGGGELRFRSTGLATRYTGQDVFVLQWGRGRGPSLRVPLTLDGPPPAAGDTRIERATYYVPGAPPGGGPWAWDFLPAGSAWPRPEDPRAGTFDLPGLRPGAVGPVAVRLRLNGASPHVHRVSARLNGVELGVASFTGGGPAELGATLDAAALRVADNRLELHYASEPSADGLVYLLHLDLTAPLVEPPAPVSATHLRPYAARVPPLGGVVSLVVAPEAFHEAAEALAARHASAGLEARVADLERVYDRYSAGVVEASAVHALVRDAAAAGVRFVTLLGDDTHDPAGRQGPAPREVVPSLYAWDQEFGRVPSENLYADVDADGVPDVAIGRLPAGDAAEALALVAKLGQAGPPAARHLLASDNQMPGEPSFDALAAVARPLLPAGEEQARARLSDGVTAAREALFKAWDLGLSSAHFFGHGGFESWADELLLATTDLPALAGRPAAVVFTWACESQWYVSPFGPTLGEALVLSPAGGALASFGPAGITAPQDQQRLFSELYPLLFDKRLPLGEAVRVAKEAALRKDPARLGPVIEGFNLLGDPTLVVR